jgi:hypothetical protein
VITATLVAWAGSQFFGVGEIADIILFDQRIHLAGLGPGGFAARSRIP